MLEETVTAAWVHQMLDAAEALGCERSALLVDIGYLPAELHDLTARVQIAPHDRLYRKMAVEQGRDEFEGASKFASTIASRFLPSGLGVAGIAMAASDTIAEAGEALNTLRDLMGARYVAPTVSGNTERVEITYPVPDALGQHPERGQVSLLSAYLLNRNLVDQNCKPLEVWFQHKAPPRLHWYEENFPDARLRFGQSTSKIILPLSIHQRIQPLPVPDPNAYRIVRSIALPPQSAQTPADKVRAYVESALDCAKYARLTEDHAATALHVSGRQLSRLLRIEQTSFSSILEQVRHARARRYLASTSYGLKAIALMLGYARHSAFTVAFARWEKMPPSVYRQNVRFTNR